MAGGKTKIEVHLTAVDKVSNALKAVGSRISEIYHHPLKAVGSLVKATARMAAGFVAAGAALATAIGTAVVSASKKLSALTDAAARAGTTSSDLHALSVVFGELGVKGADIQTVSNGLQKMAQTTGQVGVEGFKNVLAAISEIGDEQERLQMLSGVFGRSFGPGLAHLVRQGPEAFREGLDGCLASVASVENAVADSADSIADGWNRMTDGMATGWQTFVVTLANDAVSATGKTGAQIGAEIAARFAYLGEVAAVWMQKTVIFFKNAVESWRQDSGAFCEWLGRTILQASDRITGPILHFFSRLWGYARAIYNSVVALFTDENVGDAWAKTLEDQEEGWKAFHDELMRPVKIPGVGLIDTSALDERLEEARRRLEEKKAAIEGLADNTAKAASGLPIVEGAEEAGDVLENAADRVSKAFRDAAGIRADSYEAQRLVWNRGRDQMADNAKTSKNILQKLADLLQAQKEGVGYLGELADGLEVV